MPKKQDSDYNPKYDNCSFEESEDDDYVDLESKMMIDELSGNKKVKKNSKAKKSNKFKCDEDSFSPESSEEDRTSDSESDDESYSISKDDDSNSDKKLKDKGPTRNKAKKNQKEKIKTVIIEDKNDVNSKKKASKKVDKVSKDKVDDKNEKDKNKKEKADKPKEKKEKVKKEILDSNFNLESAYFYKDLTNDEKSKISSIIKDYWSKDLVNSTNVNELELLAENVIEKLNEIKSLKYGSKNYDFLVHTLDEIARSYINSYESKSVYLKSSIISNCVHHEFCEYKPVIRECHFFPNVSNEVKVVNMLRTSKYTLDIAIFALTNDSISAGIEEAFNRGVKVRIIADDECAKFAGAEVFKLASLGIPTKTDNSFRFHMHHKFAIIDKAVVVTGSFNWTTQAVKYNQENIMFIENVELAEKYTEAYNNLWNTFEISISKEEGLKKIKEHELEMAKRLEKRKETQRLKAEEKEKNAKN